MIASGTDSLHDAQIWLRGSGLEIVLFVLGTILLTRFATWLRDRVTDRIEDHGTELDSLVSSEGAKHRHAVAQVVTWTLLVLLYCLSAILIVQRLGVPLTGFVAPATVVGVALGFGAQRIVQDVLAGFFVIAERQYGFGDLVRLTVLGAPVAVTGTVEEVTLRITRIRTTTGEVVTTPNGQIIQVTNLSRDWARAVIDVPIPVAVDVARVNEVLSEVGKELFGDPAMHDLLLDQPSVMGIESMDLDQFKVRMVARTLPGKQFDVSRVMRGRVTAALLHNGIMAAPDLPDPDLSGSDDPTVSS
jgi:small-conductance mechanosensitive channel